MIKNYNDYRDCGIYQILNIQNNKFYIGSTKKCRERQSKHFTNLNKNRHKNSKLQNAFNKLQNIESFQFKMIIYCSEANLKYYEQFCIDNLNPEYNISTNAFRPSLDEETRLKIAKTVGEYGRSLGENHPSKRPEVRKKMSETAKRIKKTEEHLFNLKNALNRPGRISPNKHYDKRTKHSNHLKSKGENHASKRPETQANMKAWWHTDDGMWHVWHRQNIQHQNYWGS